jgi:chemotaxis protein MotB
MPQHVDNHERWLVSYADFITLLFALFVVMYATTFANMSNVGKLSRSILEAFNLPVSTADSDPNSGEMGNLISAQGGPEESSVRIPLRPPEIPAEIVEVSRRLEASMGELAVADGVRLRRTDLWMEVDIPSDMVFPSGSRVLLNDAIPILDRIAAGLQGMVNDVVVQAHTDDQFIDNGLFVSNWELSTARAAALVRFFVEAGIAPERLAATGFAGYRPVADNATPEGRRRNQRLVLRIPATSVTNARVVEEQDGGAAAGG